MSKGREVKRISWYELQSMHPTELKQKFKINDRQLEQSLRTHLDGATANERREVYHQVWDSKNKS